MGRSFKRKWHTVQFRTWEDAQLTHDDALFLFLLQDRPAARRAGGPGTRSNATAEGDEGNAPIDAWLAVVDREVETVRIALWIPVSAMEDLAHQAQVEGIPIGTLAGRRLAEALLSFPLNPQLSAGEVLTLHAATGLDEEGQPCFTVILPQ